MPPKPEFTSISHEHRDGDELDEVLRRAMPPDKGTTGTSSTSKRTVTVTSTDPVVQETTVERLANLPVGTETVVSLPHDPKNDDKKTTGRMRKLFEGVKE